MKKRLNSLTILIIELLLTVSVGITIIITNLSSLQDKAEKYTSDLESDYQNLEHQYVSVFKAMTIHIREMIVKDPSFEEMDRFLKQHDQLFADAVGPEIFDGFAMTYKGKYAHSWNYGEYSQYDPNTRPWYQEAQKANGQVVVVAPYVTYLDPSYLKSDQYIELTIAQRYNDKISFDLDLKIKDINAIISKRALEYKGASAILFDRNGYILSTTNESLYCHNINTPDSTVTKSLSNAMLGLDCKLDQLNLMTINGNPYAVYASRDGIGNTYSLMIPFRSIFIHNFLIFSLVMLLLIVVEISIYTRSLQTLAEIAEKNRRDQERTALAIAHHYITVIMGNAITKQFTVIKASPYLKSVYDPNTPMRIVEMNYVEKFVRGEFVQDFLNMFSFESIEDKLAESEAVSFTAQLKDGHWLSYRVIRTDSDIDDGSFILFVESADEQMRRQAELQEALARANEATAAKSEPRPADK